MNLKGKLVLLFSLLFIVMGITSCAESKTTTQQTSEQALNIHIIDVGQGDSTLLECDDEYMLIDAGETEYGTAVAEYLEQCNVDKLDYVVVTHPHSDHYGGLKTVLESVEAENIIMTEAYSTTRSWEELIDYIDQSNYNVIQPRTNDAFMLGEATVTAYVPTIDNDDLNNCSIILRADYRSQSALFTGDAEKSEELDVLESGFNVKADVLSVGHHGSSTSTCEEFFTEVNPHLALISCGKNNDYGHPHKETTALLKEHGVKAMRTDEEGSILLSLNNSTIDVSTTNGYTNSFDFKRDDTTDNTESNNDVGNEYIGNKNSKVYHSSDCSSVGKMSDKNKVVLNSAEEAEENGYTPCQKCNP